MNICFKFKQKESEFFLKTQLKQYFKGFKQQIDVFFAQNLNCVMRFNTES